ncbi:hypothetical protein ETB97_001955 [Aspergillus alliaceus]|uniref:Uncharacterized protein n=1 Tax=Petromyces alliaceus TaxID=209559 RepID=A0A8H6AER0_PETAA|nr:hypothetical protein ETB97_001955 [Aspergillus burnettii]
MGTTLIRSSKYRGRTPLERATQSGHETVVELLLKRRADSESLNTDNRMPPTRSLHIMQKVATLLMEELQEASLTTKPDDTGDSLGGADPNKPDRSGKRPIQSVFDGEETVSLGKHRLNALACLLMTGQGKETDVNVSIPHTKNSLLHLAVRRQNPMAVGMLLFRGPAVNAKN